MNVVIAVDPGREKTGVAIVREDLTPLDMVIVPTEDVGGHVEEILQEDGLLSNDRVVAIVCGDGTYHDAILQALEPLSAIWKLPLVTVNEKNTTVEGRHRYWTKNKPNGWRSLIPTLWLTPPRPVDDFTAWVIGERYFMDTRKE